MPGRMGEVPDQFPLAKHTTRRAIHFSGSHARTNCRDGRLLRFQHGLVQPSSFSRRPSDMHSSRAIRTITGEYNTKITDHEPTPGNAHARGPAMHNRRARSGSEYRRKRHAFGPGTTGFGFHSGGAERRRALPFSIDASRSRMPAVIDSGSMPTDTGVTDTDVKDAGVELLPCAASHSTAATSGNLRAMTMFT